MPATDLITKILRVGHANGFDKVIQKVRIISAGNGSCVAELKVDDNHTNPMGGLHGGFSATLVDVISGLGLLTHDEGACPSVSVNMNIDYINGAKVDDVIQIHSNLLKIGKKMAFLGVQIKNKDTGLLLVNATHIKSLYK